MYFCTVQYTWSVLLFSSSLHILFIGLLNSFLFVTSLFHLGSRKNSTEQNNLNRKQISKWTVLLHFSSFFMAWLLCSLKLKPKQVCVAPSHMRIPITKELLPTAEHKERYSKHRTRGPGQASKHDFTLIFTLCSQEQRNFSIKSCFQSLQVLFYANFNVPKLRKVPYLRN